MDATEPAKLNAGWYRLAIEVGLFTDDHEFLVVVCDVEPDWPVNEWARVRLTLGWDIAGSDSTVLGSSDGCAAFTALSLDNRVAVIMTWWGDDPNVAAGSCLLWWMARLGTDCLCRRVRGDESDPLGDV